MAWELAWRFPSRTWSPSCVESCDIGKPSIPASSSSALTDASADRQNTRLQAALDVLASLDEIDAAPEDLERMTPEALTRMQRSMDTLRGYLRNTDLFGEHAGTAFL